MTGENQGHKDANESKREIWNLISKNIEWINYANLSNSFVILQVLNETEKALSANEIAERIAQNTQGTLYRIPATIRDALEHRFMREKLVDGKMQRIQTADGRKMETLHFTITTKGKELLKGWTAFVRAYA